jgi:HSP20 family protein
MSQIRYLDHVIDYRKTPNPNSKAQASIGKWTPPVDIQESEKAFHVIVELPGVKDNEIDITLDKSILTIKGDRLISSTEGFNSMRQERASGSFVRQFTLPDSVAGENITATSDLGVLNITIPKADLPKPFSIVVGGTL